jgi:hypothetical protein
MAAPGSMARRSIRRVLILSCALAPGMCHLSAQLPGRGLAVVVGINQYQDTAHWPALRLAENDARDLATALQSHGFQVTLLTGAQSTKHNILQALYSLSRDLQPDDHIVFFFAGHGFGETPSNGKPRRGYIVPYDGADYASYISSSELEDISENLDAAHHQLFLIDSCYAGLIHTRAANPDEPSDPKYIQNLNERNSREVLAASGQDQETPDSGFDGRDSYFVNALLEALSGQADYNHDGYITFSELQTYVVTRASNRYSTPAYGAFPGSGGGEFIFLSPHSPARTDSATMPDQPRSITPSEAPPVSPVVAAPAAESKDDTFWQVFDDGLLARGVGRIHGHVISPSGAPQTNGTITLSWGEIQRAAFPLSSNGQYAGEAPPGMFTLTFRSNQLVDRMEAVEIKAGYGIRIDVDMSRPGFVPPAAVQNTNPRPSPPVSAPQTSPSQSSGSVIRQIGTITSIRDGAITLKLDSGPSRTFLINSDTRIRLVDPSAKSAAEGIAVSASELAVGDRTSVASMPTPDNTTLLAVFLTIMKRDQIIQKQQADIKDWQRNGVAGRVQAIQPFYRTIMLANCAGPGKVITNITVTLDAVIRRYPDSSLYFADAASARFDQIKVGDILRARGTQSPGMMTAKEIVFGKYPATDPPDIVPCK